jgi:hypothetical protein
MKEQIKCNYCGKGGKLNWYIIADDLENPRPYHLKCIKKMKLEALKALYKIESEKKQK